MYLYKLPPVINGEQPEPEKLKREKQEKDMEPEKLQRCSLSSRMLSGTY